VRDGRACCVGVHLVAADTPTGSRGVAFVHNPWASPAFMSGSNMGITSGLFIELRGFDECRLTGKNADPAWRARSRRHDRGSADNGASTP